MINRTTLLVTVFSFVTMTLVIVHWNNREQVHTPKQEFVVMNVLDTNLYQDCHIPGSINVTLDMLSPEWCTSNLKKDAEIVVYCSNYRCMTSEYVAKKLKEFGFSKVCVYEGGIAEWYQEGYPVIGPCKQSYLSCKIEKPSHDNTMEIDTILLQDLANKMKVAQNTKAV